jgi:hypothetical protein
MATWEIPEVLSVVLVQDGIVTPARGRGVLQLEATTLVTGVIAGEPLEVEFLSVGFQNNDCSVPSP